MAAAQRDQARTEQHLRHWVHRRGLAALDALLASPQLADLGPEGVCWLQEQLCLVAPATADASASFTGQSLTAPSGFTATTGSISAPAAAPASVSVSAAASVLVAGSEAEASENLMPAFVQQLVEQTKNLDLEPVAPIQQELPPDPVSLDPVSLDLESLEPISLEPISLEPVSLDLEALDLESPDLESLEPDAPESVERIGAAVSQCSSLAVGDLGAAGTETTLVKGVWPQLSVPQLSVVPDGAPAPAQRSLAPLRAWLPDGESGVRRLGQDRRDLPLAS